MSEYVVGKNKKIIFRTSSAELLDKFTDCLCDSYEESFDDNGGHELYEFIDGKYLYIGCTTFGYGGVTSRGMSPRPNQTDYFLEKYEVSNE